MTFFPVDESKGDDDIAAFISDGYVSFFGEKVAVKSSRDTGAKHSESVLPFSIDSNTGNFILI